jgi:hypothetical protein
MGRWSIEQALTSPPAPHAVFRITKLECPLIERDSIAPPRA